MNHHAFLVGVSRHRSEVRLYTDDPDTLAERIIRNPGDKTSAMEGRAARRVDGLRASLNLIAKVFGGEPETAPEMAIKVTPEIKPDVKPALEPDPRSMLTPNLVQRAPRAPTVPEPAREVKEELEQERSRGMGMGM